jgi:hypothetical protein
MEPRLRVDPQRQRLRQDSPGEADGIMRYRITIPTGLTGAFHYNVRLVSQNFQVTSFAQGNPFLLV